MGLAPYGEPRFAELIRNHLVDLKPDGSFRLDLSFFDFMVGNRMWSGKFERLIGGAGRSPNSEITNRERDLAASIQRVTEEILLGMANHIASETGLKNICLAGGVALNCVANGRLLRESPFENVWIQPAAGDAGGALGAALFVAGQLLDEPCAAMSSPFLGPHVQQPVQPGPLNQTNVETCEFLTEEMIEVVARELAAGKMVGWAQGRMEFGPRALGNRSILADPRDPEMKDHVNNRVKFRESFRPFAPAVMKEHASEYFELEEETPWMTIAANVRGTMREKIPAVTHVDGSARVQTVSKEHNQRFHQLLGSFHKITGVPVLLNTSFNLQGEPIVCTSDDAMCCFLASGLDVLVINNQVWWKKTQDESR